MKVEKTFKCLGDTFKSKVDNVALCKRRVNKSVGSIIEIVSLCKETNFGKHQIFSMMVTYQSVFLPRLIYDCESWSILRGLDILTTPVFDRPLFSPDVIILFENFQIVAKENFLKVLPALVVTGLNTE